MASPRSPVGGAGYEGGGGKTKDWVVSWSGETPCQNPGDPRWTQEGERTGSSEGGRDGQK